MTKQLKLLTNKDDIQTLMALNIDIWEEDYVANILIHNDTYIISLTSKINSYPCRFSDGGVEHTLVTDFSEPLENHLEYKEILLYPHRPSDITEIVDKYYDNLDSDKVKKILDYINSVAKE